MRVAMSWQNGWTGGQYSVARALLGSYTLAWFVLLPYAGPSALVRVAGALASVGLVIGWGDRLAASVLFVAGLFFVASTRRVVTGPTLCVLALLLARHALVRGAPYGSLKARDAVDPGSTFRMAPVLFGAVWCAMAASCTLTSYVMLRAPWPSLAFAQVVYATRVAGLVCLVGAVFARARCPVWCALLCMSAARFVCGERADAAGALIVLLFAFDPAWVQARHASGADLVFYDGTCGVCHGFVRFLISEDFAGNTFRFAPLQSDAFFARIPLALRAGLPDSVVVVTSQGEVLVCAGAVRRVLARLGGLWGVLGWMAKGIPSPLLDRGYTAFAARRKRLAAAPREACPILPPALRQRFDA